MEELTMSEVISLMSEYRRLHLNELKEYFKKIQQKQDLKIDQYERIIALCEMFEDCRPSLVYLEMNNAALKKLRVDCIKSLCQRMLGMLRSGNTFYLYLVINLREWIKKGSFTIEDFGTSNEEIVGLRSKSCQTFVLEYLQILRSGVKDEETYNWYLGRIDEEITQGGFTLKDVGTSELEVAGLRPSSYITV